MQLPRRCGNRGGGLRRVSVLVLWTASCAVAPPRAPGPPTAPGPEKARPPSNAPGVVPPRPFPVEEPLRVVAYNIRHGRGMDDVVDLPRIVDVLRALDADVITLQEVDDRTARTDRVDQVAVLADLLGYRGFHGPHRPYQGGYYGNAVLTRLPVRCAITHPIPPASGSALSVLEVEIEAAAGSVSIVSVHLAGSPDERMAQARAVSGMFRDHGHPVILAGDFNGRPDDAVVRALTRDWTVVPKSGDPGTYPADGPDREIDFVMFRHHDPVQHLEHVVVEEALASDHRPLLAILSVHARLPRPTTTPCTTP